MITLDNVSKSFRTYAHPWDRLKEVITHRPHHQDHHALLPLSMTIGEGHVVGLVGTNGAGKSTLLKLIAGTLLPTTGTVSTQGQVAALLELGAGFHPEMSGRENVYLGAAVAGLSREFIENRYEEIVRFTGLVDAMDRPVKTYSSGMTARLAFAVAMAVEPEILILDETLSVGDGAFARRSFERIIDFKRSGKTLLFCSHSMYQVESICDRVLWIDHGQVMMDGEPAEVVSTYTEFLTGQSEPPNPAITTPSASPMPASLAQARILDVKVSVDGYESKPLTLESGASKLSVTTRFKAPENLPLPSLGIVLVGGNGWPIASASSLDDALRFTRNPEGIYQATVSFPSVPLLKGNYWINLFLMCEKGIHFYERAERVAEFTVVQNSREVGLVSLTRNWHTG